MTGLAHRLAALPADQRGAVLAELSVPELDALAWHWPLWARPDQLPPPGDWRTWVLLSGRGAGKTRAGAEWVRGEIEAGRRRCIALAAQTHLAGRKVMIEGPSGLLAVCPPWAMPTYEMATGVVRWPSGAQAHLVTAEAPDRIRGFNFDGAWCDELASWDRPDDTWQQLVLATRITGPQGDAPRIVVTTTPRPLGLLRAVLADATTTVTRASTFANAAHLDPAVLRHLREHYDGTTLGRQELGGEMIEDADGALWTRALIDAGRVTPAPELRRVVVAVDPSGTRAGDEAGIIVAGVGQDGQGYVIADLSRRASPEQWARIAVQAYHAHRADRIVAEANFGAEMVAATIRSVDRDAPVRLVHASRGKAVRAEPVVALYEQCRVHHVGTLAALEDELCQWEPSGSMPSPGRLDALVWAMSELMLGVRSAHVPFVAPDIITRTRVWPGDAVVVGEGMPWLASGAEYRPSAAANDVGDRARWPIPV